MTAPRPVGKATRATIVVTIVAVIVNLVLTGLGPSGFYATFGVFILLVLSDFGGPLRTRLMAYLVTGLAGLVLITLGTVAAESGLAATLVMTALVAFGLAYSLVLRGYVAAAYLSLLLPYIVAVTTPTTYKDLAIGLGSYAAGAVIAGITAVVLWPSRPEDGTRRTVGAAVAAAAAVVRGAADPAPGPGGSAAERMRDLDAAYTAMRTSYDGKLERPGDLTTADHALVRLVDDVSRLRYALDWPADDDPAAAGSPDRAMLTAAAQTLTACAQALDAGAAPSAATIEALHAAQAAHVADLPAEADRLLAAGDTVTVTRTVDAAFRHRVIAFLTASVARHTLTTVGGRRAAGAADQAPPITRELDRIDRGTRPADLLRANLNLRSPWLRRALQTAVAVTLAVLAVHELRLEIGFWVVLGIVAALQFTAVHARKSAVEVAGGTIAGFLICAGLVKLIGHHTVALVIVLIPVAFFTVWLPRGRWLVPMKQAGFTVWFVMLVSLAHGGMSMSVDEMRIKDVGTGLIIALVTTALLWRGGVAARVTAVLHDSARATGDFVVAAYAGLDPADQATAQKETETAARSAVRARDLAAETADLARTEGGAAEDEARAWTTVTNAIDHAMIVGTLVRGLADYGLAPLPDTRIARALQGSVRAGADEFTAATSPHATAHADVAALPRTGPDTVPADIPAAEIDAVIAGWSGSSDPVAVPGAAAISPGHAAIGVLWARDWAAYFRWMVRHSHPAAVGAAAPDDHT